MPDIDPNQIPTLDDVIDKDETIDEPSVDGEDSNDIREPDVKLSDSTHTGIDNQDQQPDVDDVDTSDDEIAETAPADNRVDYPQELSTALTFSYQQPYTFSGGPVTEPEEPIKNDKASVSASIDAEALSEIIENTVTGLLPDLEQQLRFLIERALREKLPDELISNDEDQNEVHS